ncbi:MAG: hypothetical protein IMF19_15300 [Proteobacteria bacterium]|nr:hypothetical protein [Pseudomonadota bacterium]
MGAYKILKDKELVVDGKPTEIKGLVAYLVEMERRNLALESDTTVDVTEQSGGNGKGLGDFAIEDLNLQGDEEYLN